MVAETITGPKSKVWVSIDQLDLSEELAFHARSETEAWFTVVTDGKRGIALRRLPKYDGLQLWAGFQAHSKPLRKDQARALIALGFQPEARSGNSTHSLFFKVDTADQSQFHSVLVKALEVLGMGRQVIINTRNGSVAIGRLVCIVLGGVGAWFAVETFLTMLIQKLPPMTPMQEWLSGSPMITKGLILIMTSPVFLLILYHFLPLLNPRKVMRAVGASRQPPLGTRSKSS